MHIKCRYGVKCSPPHLLTKRNKDKYCDYHEDHGHDTDDCKDLKREIELCIQNGHLKQFVQDVRKPDYRRDREQSRGRDRHHAEDRPPKDNRTNYDWSRGKGPLTTTKDTPSRELTKPSEGEIFTITGGPAGGESNSARRARCRHHPDLSNSSRNLQPGEVITFSSDDPVPDRNPEADAVIIRAKIANKLVHRIYVDPGSSAEVMY